MRFLCEEMLVWLLMLGFTVLHLIDTLDRLWLD